MRWRESGRQGEKVSERTRGRVGIAEGREGRREWERKGARQREREKGSGKGQSEDERVERGGREKDIKTEKQGMPEKEREER